MFARISRLINLLFIIILLAFDVSAKKFDDLKINSQSLEINKLKGDIIYEGNVMVNFSDYIIHSSKLLFKFNDKLNKNELKYIIFPSKIIAQKNDSSQKFILKNAKYSTSSGKIISSGRGKMQISDSIIESDNIEIRVGKLKKLSISNFKKPTI